MKRALEDKFLLNGSEGHNLRVAIVVKAQAIGMTEQETTQLFQNQDDYDRDITLSKVVEIRGYDYQPWSCGTLRDKCENLIMDYCRTCPMVERS
jgi:DNA primase large subunit